MAMDARHTLGIKRSFHCDDLPSCSSDGPSWDGSVPLSPSRKRARRQRAVSADLSTRRPSRCIGDDGATSALADLAPSTAPSLDDSATPRATARLISPANSTALVTPELAPAPSDDDNPGALPHIPSLAVVGGGRRGSVDCPATAALERFVLSQRPSYDTEGDDMDDDPFPSLEEQDKSGLHHPWPRQEELPSPQHVQDFPRIRRVSVASRKSSVSDCNPQDDVLSQGQGLPYRTTGFLASALSLWGGQPQRVRPYEPTPAPAPAPAPTVGQLAEALAKL